MAASCRGDDPHSEPTSSRLGSLHSGPQLHIGADLLLCELFFVSLVYNLHFIILFLLGLFFLAQVWDCNLNITFSLCLCLRLILYSFICSVMFGLGILQFDIVDRFLYVNLYFEFGWSHILVYLVCVFDRLRILTMCGLFIYDHGDVDEGSHYQDNHTN